MASPTAPLTDLAAPVLSGEPTINDEQRAELWDAFHTKNPSELVQHLQPLAVPDDFKRRLFEAKQKSMPPIEPLDKVSSVISHLAQIPPEQLDLAETHPNVLKTLTAALDKGSESPSGASKPVSKGDTANSTAKPAPLAQPPRTDGLSHLPPIPDGHHRILASDGGVHDIPAEHIEKARAIDPNMHVLNP